MMSLLDLNLWNEKFKLRDLVYEITLLCFKCLNDRYYGVKLMKPGYGLALNEACMAMRCISQRRCTCYMPRFQVMARAYMQVWRAYLNWIWKILNSMKKPSYFYVLRRKLT